MHKIEIENRISQEKPLTVTERFNAAFAILEFDKIKERYQKNKNDRAEIDQCISLSLVTGDEEKSEKLFLEFKRLMVGKLGCKEEWFEDAFLRQIQKAQIEQAESIAQAKQRAQKNHYKN